MGITGKGLVYNSSAQTFLSSTHEHVARILKDYNPYFDLVFIPEAQRGAVGKPYALIDRSPGTEEHIVRFMSETDMADPAGILTWVFDGDMRRHRPVTVFETIELREKAEQMLRIKEWEEAGQIRRDKTEFLLTGGRDRKHTVRFNNKKLEVA